MQQNNLIDPSILVETLLDDDVLSKQDIVQLLIKNYSWDEKGAITFVKRRLRGYSKLYHYSYSLDSWSRVLRMRSKPLHVFEVILTPNSMWPSWEDVSKIGILEHGTFPEFNDIEKDNLPSYIKTIMESKLGHDITRFLLEENIMSKISWNLVFKNNHRNEVIALHELSNNF